MDEGPNIYRVAEDMVGRWGDYAYAYLREQGEYARLAGDRESAITWWDIALAVVEITSARRLAALALFCGFALT